MASSAASVLSHRGEVWVRGTPAGPREQQLGTSMPMYVTGWSCGFCLVSIPEAQLPCPAVLRDDAVKNRGPGPTSSIMTTATGVNAMTAAHPARMKLLGNQNLEHQSISLGFRYWPSGRATRCDDPDTLRSTSHCCASLLSRNYPFWDYLLWQYLFGRISSGTTYLVVTADGQALRGRYHGTSSRMYLWIGRPGSLSTGSL